VFRLIITADDFGLAVPVNEAVEQAHSRGILTTASLMVGAHAAADAVERARRLTSLRVGLHVTLVEARPVLSPDLVPDLVNEQGEFPRNLVAAGFNFFFRPGVRRQLEAEIRAQFQAFQETGLPLDHVNTHHHVHLHPTVSGLILKVGREFGLRAMRLPCEPVLLTWRATRRGLLPRIVNRLFLFPWVTLLKHRLRREGVLSNDFLFGLSDTGCLSADLLLRLLSHLPPGVTEIYGHPAIGRYPEGDGPMLDHGPEGEFEALTSPAVLQAVKAAGVRLSSFGDLR
jgi:hopanoid biosynthesis associated protein HpnK